MFRKRVKAAITGFTVALAIPAGVVFASHFIASQSTLTITTSGSNKVANLTIRSLWRSSGSFSMTHYPPSGSSSSFPQDSTSGSSDTTQILSKDLGASPASGIHYVCGSSGARVSSIVNNASSSFGVEVGFNPYKLGPPAFTSNLRTNVAKGVDFTTNLGAVDPDGTSVTYTAIETTAATSCSVGSASIGYGAPLTYGGTTYITLASDGTVTIPAAATNTMTSGQKLVLKVKATDADGEFVTRDILFTVLSSSNSVPGIMLHDASHNHLSSPYDIEAGSSFTVNIHGLDDTDDGDTVTITATGLPTWAGSLTGTTSGNPTSGSYITASVVFSPTVSDIGSSATVNFEVTDDDSQGSGAFPLTTTETITFNVVAASPAFSYPASTLTLSSGSAMSAATPSSSGGPVTSWSVSPSLPTGLSLDTTTGTISGTPVGYSAASTYVVSATNSGGTTTETLTISVAGVPGTPSSLAGSASSSSATLTWTAPSDGGSAITGYEYSLDGGSTWTSTGSSAASATISSLSASTAYTVELRAVNAVGESTTPASLSFTTSAAPAAPAPAPAPTPRLSTPGAPGVETLGAGSIRASIGGVTSATAYTVRLYGASGVVSTVSVGPNAGFVTFSDLDATVAYRVTVTAIGGNGTLDSAESGATRFRVAASANTTDPTVPSPVPSGTEPVLVTEDDAPLLERQPGTSGAILNGVPTDTRQSAGDRTVIQRFIAGQPAGASNPVTVNGDNQLPSLITDDNNNPVPIPDTNIVIVETDTTALALAAQRSDGQPGTIRSDGTLVVDRGRVGTAGYGFTPSRVGEIVLFSEPQLVGTFTTDATGAFTAQFDLPAGIEPGPHTIVLTLGTETKAVGIYVEADTPTVATPTPATLPVTGDTTPINWIILTLTFGAWTLLATRRRTSV
jgi:hypothetical protein